MAAPPCAPQLPPPISPPGASPLLPWVAGAFLSLLVLALAVPEQSWLDLLGSRPPAVPDSVATGPIDNALTPEPAAMAPPAPPAGLAKSPPTVVPISAEGRRRTKVESEPERSPASSAPPAQERRAAPPQRDVQLPLVVPISAERPQSALTSGVQLLGTAADEAAAPVALIDYRREVTPGAPEGSAAGGLRVFIHYGAARTEDAAIAARLADYLRRRGFEIAGVRPVEISIGTPGLRYYFERDRAESRRLVKELGWFFRDTPQQAPERASDFTHYTPRPRPGSVEIWLPTVS